MTLILPILIASLVMGIATKRMTTPLWMLMTAIIVVAIGYFYIRH